MASLNLRLAPNTNVVTTSSSSSSSSSCPCIAATLTLTHFPISFPRLASRNLTRFNFVSCHSLSVVPPGAVQYEFCDGAYDVELRLLLTGMGVQSSKEIQVDVDDNSLSVRVKKSELYPTLMETTQLYGRVKPGETIWYLDDDQLVINLRKQDEQLKWPGITESWESLSVGVFQLLKGTSIFLVGDSSEINQKVSEELAVGLGYALV
ncbi:hypothetical protein RND81_02G053600 [Saponaria officinalis]|uniref:CS domain-containing protein n=1 Tax=Saponaria officinalis TaxID=3572 RepID=A0AAW1MJM6_SAPOF